MMSLKSIFIATTIVAASFATNGLAQDRIAYGTTDPQSSVYSYAVAAAKAINTISGSDVNVTVLATGGAIDNLVRMSRGQIQLGLGNMAAVYQAYKGLDKFEGNAATKLRGLWVYQISLEPYIVRADSGIETIEGLTGKPWSAGQRGSATEALVIQTLDAIGVKPDYYRASLADAVEAIKNGQNMGFAKAMAGKGLDAATLELATTVPIRILSFTAEQAAKIKDALPYLSFVTIPKGTIRDVDYDFTTWSAASGHYTYNDLMTDEQVISVLKGIVDGRQYQEEVWAPMRGTDIIASTIESMPILLHAGAVKFFRERGYTVPDHLVPPEMK